MTLEQFAKKAGVSLLKDGKGFAYTQADCPHSTVVGFWTPNAAYKGWLSNTFGNRTSKAILSLLKASEKK